MRNTIENFELSEVEYCGTTFCDLSVDLQYESGSELWAVDRLYLGDGERVDDRSGWQGLVEVVADYINSERMAYVMEDVRCAA